jgi:hydroxymethylbilane synthase
MNPVSTPEATGLAAPLRIATRESRLAIWQAEHVRALLVQRLGVGVDLLGMTTRGDQILDRTLSKVGGKGLVVKELEAALEDGRAELAVHSLKDVPMQLPDGFVLAAVLAREDPRDAFVCARHASLEALPRGAVIGTSSLRRAAQLLSLRPDLRIEPLRGNLDTRLRKLDDGAYDAIVLAAAGLARLGLESRIRERIDPRRMLPAAGQGALAIEVRSEAHALRAMLASLADRPTTLAVEAERAVSRGLGGSCSVPLAAHASWGVDGGLQLAAVLGDARDPARALLRAGASAAVDDVTAALALGAEVVAALRSAGADDYLDPSTAGG